MEVQLFDKLDVVMAIGKRGNKVPVLIPDDARRSAFCSAFGQSCLFRTTICWRLLPTRVATSQGARLLSQ